MSDTVERLRDWVDNPVGRNPAKAPCAEAAAEIERLRAGGCARNQRTTQWCAEASGANVRALRAEAQVAALREALAKIAGINELGVTNYDRGRQQWDFQAIARTALEEK